jgi:hypothetical protein
MLLDMIEKYYFSFLYRCFAAFAALELLSAAREIFT